MKPGHFKLFDSAVPKLRAGKYDLVGNHELGGPTEELRTRIRVRSVRYKLPPEQILSVWPPANDEGAFESRLPQIAIRRRTLPWERDPGSGAQATTPWLALVVIAEDEGTVSDEVPVAECATPDAHLDGDADSPTGVYLGVTKPVIDKVFPTIEDLRYLTHVRQVDLHDTELALGDDDGFLAMVLANRLPQFDRAAGKPVRYQACLINLEQQLGVLPKAVTPSSTFEIASESLKVAMEIKRQATAVKAEPAVVTRRIEDVALRTEPGELAGAVRREMKGNFTIPVEQIVGKLYRFPVLAHWSFTCTGAGDFESLMQGLDVGLLGTAPPPTVEDPQAADPAAPPPPPAARPAPELAETGHVGLGRRSRRGDATRAWYRGPFVPHPTERDLAGRDGDGERLAFAHVSDQLRWAIPDGREELGYAAAFEIGRLLTLARPLVVATLMRWRSEHFGAERARAKAELSLAGLSEKAKRELGAESGGELSLGQVLGRGILLRAATEPDAMLGPSRPLVDPGRPLEGIDRPLEQILSEGFEIPVEKVRRLIENPLAGPGLTDVPRIEIPNRRPIKRGGP